MYRLAHPRRKEAIASHRNPFWNRSRSRSQIQSQICDLQTQETGDAPGRVEWLGWTIRPALPQLHVGLAWHPAWLLIWQQDS